MMVMITARTPSLNASRRAGLISRGRRTVDCSCSMKLPVRWTGWRGSGRGGEAQLAIGVEEHEPVALFFVAAHAAQRLEVRVLHRHLRLWTHHARAGDRREAE